MITDNFLQNIINLIEEKMGENTVAIDVKSITTMTEYIIITTTTSLTHSNALTDALLDYFHQEKKRELLYNTRPQLNNEWILIDAGYFIINIFLKEAREFYSLERLYFKGKVVYNSNKK